MPPDDPRPQARVNGASHGVADSTAEQVHLRQLLRSAGRKLRRQSEIMHLLYEVTRIANEARDLASALQATLDTVCHHIAWPLGHVYLPNAAGDTMLPSPTWSVRNAERFARFCELTARTTFTRGRGRVGRAWSTARPQWMKDVTRDPVFVRHATNEDLGVRGALIVPVRTSERVVAVLEFFSDRAEEPDEPLMHAMDQMGLQLGHVHDREQAAQRQGATELARAQLAHILEITSDFVGTASADGSVLYLNPGGRALVGLSEDADLCGMSVTDFHPPWAARRVLEEAIPQALQGRVWQSETALLTRSGREIPISQVILAHFDSTGALECLSTVARDMSDRKRNESLLLNQSIELHLANAQLERAARLKDEFLANMSHELRTPLNAILGLSEAMQEGVFGTINAEQESSLQTIRDSGGHLLALINDILDLSKAEAGRLELELEPVNLEDVVRAGLQFVKQAARTRRIAISTVFPPRPTWVVGDARRLKQIVVNLVGNAVKFTPEGGNVTVALLADEDRHAVRLDVRDTGIGIAEDDLKRLFQPFVQLHTGLSRKYEGTGLGLSLVARMVELHGGSVAVESRPGEGSCFSVFLPAPAPGQEPPYDAQPEEAPAPSASLLEGLQGLTVLLVEDNEVNVATTRQYLEKKGCTVRVARDGVEGVRMAREAAPDLILMDIQMPRMDGLEAIRTLRQDPERADLPIIALTALVLEEDRARCFDAGADRCLSKPVPLSALVHAMLDALEHHRHSSA